MELRRPPKPAKDAVDETREKHANSRLKEAKVLMVIFASNDERRGSMMVGRRQ
jgi:hypothetical protein